MHIGVTIKPNREPDFIVDGWVFFIIPELLIFSESGQTKYKIKIKNGDVYHFLIPSSNTWNLLLNPSMVKAFKKYIENREVDRILFGIKEKEEIINIHDPECENYRF